VRASAGALPHDPAVAVDNIVIGKLISRPDAPSRHNISYSVDRLYKRVRVAARIDVAFGRSHQDDLAAGEIITVITHLAELFAQRVLIVYDARVVNGEDNFTGRASQKLRRRGFSIPPQLHQT
jgi:hypothetical protein